MLQKRQVISIQRQQQQQQMVLDMIISDALTQQQRHIYIQLPVAKRHYYRHECPLSEQTLDTFTYKMKILSSSIHEICRFTAAAFASIDVDAEHAKNIVWH
ncbi:unnamed protein product [Ceratitis capitata]|uniref:(Mediterranean fruit fly) hypothetical protein n=1 Tax=Ceratitis capitata TaxID=7213 RepID=A0A811U159_CERCA|nr:unnamed protein product [Ceratitis capitata]